MTNLQQELSRVIQVAFDNEEAFLKSMGLLHPTRMGEITLRRISMNDLNTFISIHDSYKYEFSERTTKTTDYLSWVAEIEGDEG